MEVMFEKSTLDNASVHDNASGRYERLEGLNNVAYVAKQDFIVARV